MPIPVEKWVFVTREQWPPFKVNWFRAAAAAARYRYSYIIYYRYIFYFSEIFSPRGRWSLIGGVCRCRRFLLSLRTRNSIFADILDIYTAYILLIQVLAAWHIYYYNNGTMLYRRRWIFVFNTFFTLLYIYIYRTKRVDYCLCGPITMLRVKFAIVDIRYIMNTTHCSVYNQRSCTILLQ